jgi:hypothetical protein
MLGISRVAVKLVASQIVLNPIEFISYNKNPSNGSPFQTSQNCCLILLMVIRKAGESMSLQAICITYDLNLSW